MTREEKIALHRRLQSEATDIAAIVADINEEFPGSKVVYLKLGDEEFGEQQGEWVKTCNYSPPIEKKTKGKRR